MHAVVLRTSRIHILGLIWLSCAAHLASVQAVCPSSYNCMVCDDSTPGQEHCTSCYQYYALTATSPRQCQPCGYRCRVCQIGQSCQTCDTSYGPNLTSTNSCGACVPGPDICVGGCTRNGAGKCDQCTDGYRLESNNSACTPCTPHCRSCQTSSSTCDVCSPGYFPYTNRTCGPCAANCSTYQCQQSGAGKCDKCDIGYGLTTTSTCAPCSPGCNLTIGCNTAGTCIQCSYGYGFIPSTQTCGPCSQNCEAGCSAIGAYRCDSCDPGTKPSTNGICYVTTPESDITTGRVITTGGAVESLPTRTVFGPFFFSPTTKSPGSDIYLEIGLGIGVPCVVFIILSWVLIVILLHQNRRLRKELKESRSQNAAAASRINGQQTPDSCHVIRHPRVVSRYQSLTERAPEFERYDRITDYEPIGSDTTESVTYERSIVP